MEAARRAVGDAQVLFLSTVRGLLAEAEEVRAHFASYNPTAVALPLGGRELEEIEQVLREKGEAEGPSAARKPRHGPTGLPNAKLPKDEDDSDFEDFGLFLSSSDMLFIRHLSRWGEVEMPPPSYQEAVRMGKERGVPVHAVDFDDEGYTDVFLEHVSAFALVRQGRRLRKLAKRKVASTRPEDFAVEWDRQLTRVGGYLAVERAREAKVAKEVLALARATPRVLAIVEAERMRGVLSAFDEARGGPAAAPSAPPAAPGEAHG